MRRSVLPALLAASLACATPPARTGAPDAEAPPAAAGDPWWRGAVFYEVFVRSYQDSNGDGTGDLRGLLSRLDHLNDGDPATTSDLGVDALWLMPVFESPSYHGYDVVDYRAVERDYGTLDDLDALVAAAHARGMKVVVDLVLNHTSVDHPWFRESVRSPDSPRRDFYLWSPTDLGWTQPWNPEGGSCWVPARGAFYYALFWRGMPDLNYRTRAVREEAKAIASFWLERGVDGFRLDAARHLVENGPGRDLVDTPETHAFWKEFAAHVRKVKPDAVLVGEVWTDPAVVATYYGSAAPGTRGDELDLLFDFELAGSILAGVKAGDASGIAATLELVRRTYPPGASDAPFLSNHDQVRVATALDGDARGLALVAAILLTVPGSPFLYYGEEIGMRNGDGREDPWKRTPMAWTAGPGAGFTTGEPWIELAPGAAEASVAAQSGDPSSLLSRYREILRARRGSAALRRGDLRILPAGPGTLAFLRRAGGETVLVVHNLSSAEVAVGPVPAPGATSARPLLADPAASATFSAGSVTARLPARSSAAWRIDAGGSP